MGVIGLGTMGSGIAQVCIQAGVPTVAVENTAELAARGRGSIEKQLARAVEKGKLAEDGQGRASSACSRPTDDVVAARRAASS